MRIARIAPLAAALVLAAPAGASIWPAPPPVSQALYAPTLVRAHARLTSRTCMAQQARLKIARWLAPVACEQPPRSELLLVTSLFGD